MLKEVDNRDDLTAERAASVLDAVHVESATTWTIMSVVGDLPRGLVYVYLFHQFDAPIVLNVAEEIANAPAPGPLRDLFPPETVRQVDKAYGRLIARSARCDALGYTWYVPNTSRQETVRITLSNSFGLGGQNACLVLGAM